MNANRLKRIVSGQITAVADKPPVRSILERRSITKEDLMTKGVSRGRFWEYGENGTLSFKEPVSIGTPPQIVKKKVGEFRSEQPFIVELIDCELLGPHPILLASDGRFVLEHSRRSRSLLLRGIAAAVKSGLAPIRRGAGHPDEHYDAVVPLVGPWARGYFHWFSEWYPRLAGVERYVNETGITPKLLIPANPPGWLEDSLLLLGYHPNDWCEWNGGRIQVDRMVLPSFWRAHGARTNTGGYSVAPQAYRWVHDRLTTSVTEPSDLSPSGLLISRDDASNRRIINEEAVISAIPELAPRTLSEYSLEEQIGMFRDVDLVIGPHGAGLTNLIHATDTHVLEIFGDYVNACYFTLSQGMGHVYGCLQATPRGADIRVDVDRLFELCERLTKPT